MPAVLACAGAQVDDVVRRPHDGLVVLDDNYGVAEISEPLQRLYEPVVVRRMQADGRLVADVEHAHQARADLRRQSDALRLAPAEGSCRPRQRQVVEADVQQEAEAGVDLLENLRGDGHLALG